MMKKIIAFAGSNSSNSINQQLVNYIATLTDQVELIKLTDYDAPIYNIDLETQDGIPDSINRLAEKLAKADQLIISVAEHNIKNRNDEENNSICWKQQFKLNQSTIGKLYSNFNRSS
eukprot:TRINITY_DN7759_c0_g1_i1.p3 TRINITY_DN7759_c0_g1~~TRINITY_DN7759_c0_g1_i1.p3  ORF type:complete len:117 (+),score=12.29 TRINITY_DN7759_c0_g1_i1:37-387(+)